jgi:transposase InsO family protein
MEEKYSQEIKDLMTIAKDHSEYGYRRATVELRDTYQRVINHKVVRKLMKNQRLQALLHTKPPKPSFIAKTLTQLGDKMNLVAPLLAKQKAGELEIDILQILYTDFTQITYANGTKKAELMPILDHKSKLVTGWALGPTATTEVALEALSYTEATCKQLGFTLEEVIIHHDRGSAYTSHQWIFSILVGQLMQLSYALRGCKDNPEMESFNSRFKQENQSLFADCQTLTELKLVVKERINYYNTSRRHSSIGYMSPLTYIKKYRKRR